jgi:hypothetical protein
VFYTIAFGEEAYKKKKNIALWRVKPSGFGADHRTLVCHTIEL